MRRLALVFSLSIVHCSLSLAQPNIVPNYSFEQRLQCINWGDEFTGYVADWTGQEGGGGLTWFTALCDNGGLAWVPTNEFGYQYARTGNSYAGIVTFQSTDDPSPYSYDFRNYIQVLLNSPLSQGTNYCVTFYVSLSDTSKWVCNDMGAYFSNHEVSYDPNGQVKSNFTPQVANDPIKNSLNDKVNWTRITGSFIANGGEQYIVIGNFKDDASSSIDSVGSTASASMIDAMGAYYYIDDVFVREIYYAHAGRDTNICNGSKVMIGRDTAVPGISYLWAPATGLDNPNVAQPFASPTSTTTYTLTLVNDSLKGCGCQDSVSSDVVTVGVCNGMLYVPTAFSPNGDGHNDIFLVKGTNISNFHMVIYDRWGNEMFESRNISFGWSGAYGGNAMNTGVYAYYVSGNYSDGTSFEKKGNVALIR